MYLHPFIEPARASFIPGSNHPRALHRNWVAIGEMGCPDSAFCLSDSLAPNGSLATLLFWFNSSVSGPSFCLKYLTLTSSQHDHWSSLPAIAATRIYTMNRNKLYLIPFSLGLVFTVQSAPVSGFKVLSSHTKMVTLSQVSHLKGSHATFNKVKNELAYSESAVKLVVLSGPSNDMLSYRIDGLRNPTLVFKPGAKVHILFINMDDDMKHDFRLIPEVRLKFDDVKPSLGVGTKLLKPHLKKSAYAEEFEVVMPTAKNIDNYLCTVAGHANGGMHGRIIIR